MATTPFDAGSVPAKASREAGERQARQDGAVLAHLRAVTRPVHDRLEGALGLLNGQLELGAYKEVLTRFYGFWRPWEPCVAALLQDETLFGPRRRLHLVEADLAALRLSAGDVAALPLCPLPTLHDELEALGSLYVMEGSTLGGRVILQNVGRCLKLDDRSGCAYFTGYGARTGTMWRLFLTRLNEAPAADARRIGNGAIETFERLAWWLTRI